MKLTALLKQKNWLNSQESFYAVWSRFLSNQETSFNFFVTVNPYVLMLHRKNNVLQKAQFLISDGIGISVASNALGIKRSRLPGIDTAENMLATKHSLNIALVGSKPHVITNTLHHLKTNYPHHNYVFSHHGYFKDQQLIIEKLKLVQADLIFVSLGCPKQEIFLLECTKHLSKGLGIGLGGCFDIWSKELQRAPVFVRKLGLEWLFRCLIQPYRIIRLIPIFHFLILLSLSLSIEIFFPQKKLAH